MDIGGLQKTTLIDYPNHLAAIVFTVGCNFNCPYCYNSELVKGNVEKLTEEHVLSFLEKRKELLDGLVITGGEPTLQNDLDEFIKKVKELDYKVKLDTNGSNPEMLNDLINQNLIDYIAMDIKGPPEKYEEIADAEVDIESVKKSVELIKIFENHEFRTTVLPKFLTKEDIIKTAEWLKGAKKYYLQQFQRMESMIDPSLKNEKKYTVKELKEIVNQIKDNFEVCELRDE